MSNGRVLVYGGKGALGAAVVDYFKSKNAWVLNVDMVKNDSADANILVDPTNCWIEQESRVLKGVEQSIGSEKLDAVLCVAGGWAGGNAASKDFIKNADLVWKQSVWSSAISARVAAEFLKPGGLLQLTGAAAATEGTPGMIGYGFAKAAVHQMVKSLSDEKSSGLPEDALVLAILPVTLDTPMNRKWMPKADYSKWTPLSFIAESLYKWTFTNDDRPTSGGLLKFTTENGKSDITSDI
ncbi:short chain dehydrogenase domain-containing protein [Ditylenchus destructor]|nr:short chain dehydrogenase domain-containing protein [Ditylenchus destructor]